MTNLHHLWFIMVLIVAYVFIEVMVGLFILFSYVERLGLIKARFTGGEEARGEYLAFIDAHVYVGPNWLTTPHRLLTEVIKLTHS